MEKTVPSARSTGGAGTTFEQHVGAMFLALLLTRGIPAIFLNHQVKKVSFQTKPLGWKTDDLLVACSKGDEICKFALQIKLTFHVTNNNECTKTFQSFWNDFCAPDRFNPDKDALVIATSRSVYSLDGLGKLLECARSSADTNDFNDRLKLVSKPVQKCHQTIQSIIKNTNSTDSINKEKFWRFLRTIHILFLDFTTDTSQQEASVIQWLAQSSKSTDAVNTARNTWHELVMIAADAAFSAKTFCRPDLPRDMRRQYSAIPDIILQPLTDHSATIMNDIRTTIGKTTSLPRTKLTTKIAMAFDNNIIVLAGPPGSGKSALAKCIIQQHSDNHLCLSFRAVEFGTSHIDTVLPGSLTGEQFRRFVGAQERVLIYVDGFEHLLEHTEQQAFKDLITIIEGCPNVLLLLSCRDSEVGNAISAFFAQRSLKYQEIKVPPLSADEIKQVEKEIPDLKVPLEHPELTQIMNTPYVIDMAICMSWSGRQSAPSGTKAFREKWWSDTVRNDSETVRGLPTKREKALIQLAVRRGKELRFSIPTDEIDAEVLDKLRIDSIIRNDCAGLVALTHDIIEDWAVRHWIERLAEKYEWAALPISKDIGPHHVIRRVFREWLKEELNTDAKKADRFVLSVSQDDSLPRYFIDDVLVSLLLSDSASKFISDKKDIILKDDASLLIQLVRLACVACTKFDKPSSDHTTDTSRLFVPDGEVWPILLQTVYDNLDCLLPKYYYEILELLEVWVQGTRILAVPDGATPAISVAYNLFVKKPRIRRNDKTLRRVFGIIASVPCADSDFFQKLVKQATLEPGWNSYTHHEFHQILIHPSGFAACRDLPKVMAKFILSLRLPPDSDSNTLEPGAYLYSESRFGLRKAAKSNFQHSSAFCGPFLSLLRLHPETGISLVLDLVNDASEWYGNNEEEEVPRIEIHIPGHGKVIQWADDTLWRAYRGTSDVPHVIMCALMALEYWLLGMCKDQQDIEPLLLKILSKGRSVMTTAVVASVCTAYPHIGGAVTLALLGSQDCIDLDKNRKEKEGCAPTVSYATANSWKKYYDDERKRSNALPHHQYDLKTVAHILQRKNNKTTSIEDGNCQQTAIPNTDKTYTDTPNSGEPETEKNPQSGTAFSLYDWGLMRWKRDSDDENNISWRQALTLAQNDARLYVESDRGYPIRNGPPVVAAVCVRDRWDEMSDDEHKWCISTLITEIGQYSDVDDAVVYLAGRSVDSDSISARILPKILALYPHNKQILKAVAKSLTHKSPAVSRNAARGVADYLEPNHHNLTLRCVRTVAALPNLSVNIKQQHPKKRMTLDSNGAQKVPTPLEFARLKLLEEPTDIEKELESLDIKSRYGSDAAMSVILMLGRTPDWPVTNKFITYVVQEVVNTFTTEYRAGYVTLGDNFGEKIMNALAEVSLASPKEGLPYCQPFLDAIDKHPDEVALFVEQLVLRSDGYSARSFWTLWQAFADQILKAPWIHTLSDNNSVGADLILRMMLNVNWLRGLRHHKHLLNDKIEYMSEFVGSLPGSPHVLTVFLDYLYIYGEKTQTGSLPALARHLQTVKYQELPRDRNAIRLVEYILQRYINRKPAIKTDPALRKDILLILDWLVDAGSSVAFNVRDTFTTLNVGDQ